MNMKRRRKGKEINGWICELSPFTWNANSKQQIYLSSVSWGRSIAIGVPTTTSDPGPPSPVRWLTWSSRYSAICPWMKSIRSLKKRGRPGSSFRTNDRCLYIIYTQVWLADPIESFLRIGKTKGRNDRILLACVPGDVFRVGASSSSDEHWCLDRCSVVSCRW